MEDLHGDIRLLHEKSQVGLANGDDKYWTRLRELSQLCRRIERPRRRTTWLAEFRRWTPAQHTQFQGYLMCMNHHGLHTRVWKRACHLWESYVTSNANNTTQTPAPPAEVVYDYTEDVSTLEWIADSTLFPTDGAVTSYDYIITDTSFVNQRAGRLPELHEVDLACY